MQLRDFFTLPAIIMLIIGVLLSGWFMSLVGRGKKAVSTG